MRRVNFIERTHRICQSSALHSSAQYSLSSVSVPLHSSLHQVTSHRIIKISSSSEHQCWVYIRAERVRCVFWSVCPSARYRCVLLITLLCLPTAPIINKSKIIVFSSQFPKEVAIPIVHKHKLPKSKRCWYNSIAIVIQLRENRLKGLWKYKNHILRPVRLILLE